MNNSSLTRANIQSVKPIAFSASTGMQIYGSRSLSTGWNCQLGMRHLEGGLSIVEGVMDGVGCALLTAIRVVNRQTGELVVDVDVPRNTTYCRQRVMEMVHKALSDHIYESMLHDGGTPDMMAIETRVAEVLDKCYFEQSRKAGLEWAKRIGIQF